MTREQLEEAINNLSYKWNNIGLLKDVLDTTWSQCYQFPEIYPWSNFFSGPLAGNTRYTHAIADTYGIPPTMAWELIKRITLDTSDNQYYIRISNAEAIRMSFNSLAEFISITGLPTM